MNLFYKVTYQKIFSTNFGHISPPQTSIWKIPSTANIGQFLKKHFHCDVIIRDFQRVFAKEL